MPPDKSRALAQCRISLLARQADYRRELASLDEAAAGETKSSAGDKYETAREMIAQSRSLLVRISAEPAPYFGVNRQVISESDAILLGA